MIYSANKVLDIIITDINENFLPDRNVNVSNYFGYLPDEYDKKFSQANQICVIYEGCDYSVEAPRSIRGSIIVTFLVIDQTIAVEKDKEDYLIDLFRDFITWKQFDGLLEKYPNDDFEPFFPTDERLIGTIRGGITFFAIRGFIRFVKRNIGG